MSVFLWGLLLGVNYIVSIFFYHVQHKSLTQYNGQQIPRPLIYYWEQKFRVSDFGLISKIIFKLGIRQFSPQKVQGAWVSSPLKLRTLAVTCVVLLIFQ